METAYTAFATGWGQMVAVWSDRGLWKLSFPRPSLAAAMADVDVPLKSIEECSMVEEVAACFNEQLIQELKLYWQGYSILFLTPIDWRGYTPFQTAVLQFTASIPYGQTKAYGEVAVAVGSPKAARGVGGALHANRTPVIIPCHRVIGAGGALTGFGGGLELKKALLLMEKNIASGLSEGI